MITITYDPKNGTALRDGDVELVYVEYIQYRANAGIDFSATYANEPIFARIRLGITREEISHQDVQFILDGKRYNLTPYGVFASEKWPKALLTSVNMSNDIVRAIVARIDEGAK